MSGLDTTWEALCKGLNSAFFQCWIMLCWVGLFMISKLTAEEYTKKRTYLSEKLTIKQKSFYFLKAIGVWFFITCLLSYWYDDSTSLWDTPMFWKIFFVGITIVYISSIDGFKKKSQ